MSSSHTEGRAVTPSVLDASTRVKTLQTSSASAYQKDLRRFIEWGGQVPATTDSVLKYLTLVARSTSPGTAYRRAMAIRFAHLSQDLPTPTDDPKVRPLLKSLHRGQVPAVDGRLKAKPAQRRHHKPESAKPITRSHLLQVFDAMHRNSLDRRDKALLLLCFMAALKRAELVSLNLEHLTFMPDALLISLRGRRLSVPRTGGELCAVDAVKTWIGHAALDAEPLASPLFRRFDRGSDPTPHRLDAGWVSTVLKTRMQAVGLDATSYSAQSLRRGRMQELAKGVL